MRECEFIQYAHLKKKRKLTFDYGLECIQRH